MAEAGVQMKKWREKTRSPQDLRLGLVYFAGRDKVGTGRLVLPFLNRFFRPGSTASVGVSGFPDSCRMAQRAEVRPGHQSGRLRVSGAVPPESWSMVFQSLTWQ